MSQVPHDNIGSNHTSTGTESGAVGLQRKLHCPLNKGFCRHRKTDSNKHFRCATLKSPPGIQEQRASAVRASAGKQHKMQRHIYSQPCFKSCNFLLFMPYRWTVCRYALKCASPGSGWTSSQAGPLQDSNANTLLPFTCRMSSSACVAFRGSRWWLATAGGDLVDSPKARLSNWPPPFCPFCDHIIVMLHPQSPGGSLSRIALNSTEA